MQVVPRVKKFRMGSQAKFCNTTRVTHVEAVTAHIVHQKIFIGERTESNKRQKNESSENLTVHRVVQSRKSTANWSRRKSEARSMNAASMVCVS